MRPFYFADVQRRVLEQHVQIRARVHGLQRSAESIDVPGQQRAMRALLFRFAALFDAHLAYEERELGPRIREVDAWGAAREAALRAEHRDQRRRIEQVCALADDPADAPALFEEVAALADELLADMAVEERMMASLALIDEQGHIDQMTG